MVEDIADGASITPEDATIARKEIERLWHLIANLLRLKLPMATTTAVSLRDVVLRVVSAIERSTATAQISAFDLAFVELQVKGTTWSIERSIQHLKDRGVRLLIVATGDVDAESNLACKQADGIASEKVPQDLTPYITYAK